MAKSKNKDLPHHVKERLRHQKLQKILENVACRVPKPAVTKRETKAKKLRRVVLYIKYLIHKNEELNKMKSVAFKRNTKWQDMSAKTNVTFSEFPTKYKSKRQRAHIVFLAKSSDGATNKQKNVETLIHKKCCSNMKNELELQTVRDTGNVIDQSRPKNVSLSENGLELYHEKSIQSAADVTNRYVPNGKLENLSDYDMGLWKEDYSASSKSSAERKVDKSASNCIFRDQIINDCINEKESIINDLDRNGTGLEQYIKEFSKDLETMHESNSPDQSLFQSDKLERSCIGVYNNNKEKNFINSCKKLSSDAEYSFHKIERPCSFNEFVALKNYHLNCDTQAENHQSFSQNSDDSSFGESGTFITLNKFEMPYSFNKSESKKNDEQCFDDIKINKHQNSKNKMFSQMSDDLSPDIFSSGESSTIASLHNFEKSPVSSCSARAKIDPPNYSDAQVDKYQLSKHPSFSQSSDNFSSEIFSSGESGILISSNENILSESEHIALSDILHKSSNTSPHTLHRPVPIMGDASFDSTLMPPQKNCDIITSPDIFCDTKHDDRRVSSDFSVENILSKSCIKKSPLFSPNSERYLDNNIHEPNYNVPFIHNNAYSDVVDNRFINYFGINNYSQNIPLQALPPFAQIGNYPAVNIGSVIRYSNIVPNDEIYAINTYCPNNASDFNHSLYTNEHMGNYLRVPVQQEFVESFLPSEEVSYSLNNLADSGYCFSQRNFNTR